MTTAVQLPLTNVNEEKDGEQGDLAEGEPGADQDVGPESLDQEPEDGETTD